MTTSLHTASLRVDERVIREYAELTQDFNPIHVDPAFAATTPMGGVIAHGTLSMCLMWQSLAASFGGDALDSLLLDVRFVKPVRVGDRLTAGGQAREQIEDGRQVFDVWVRGDDGADRIVGTVSQKETA